MNTFEKSQAVKILATYMAPEELEDLEKGHPVGHINAHGKQKQADGSWKYVGKNKASQNAPESSGGEKKPTQSAPKKSSKVEGVDPKGFADMIAKDKADGKFPMGFVKVNDPSSPLHGKYFKVAAIGSEGTQIYVGDKKLKNRLSKEQISERIKPSDIAEQAAASKEKETQAGAANKLGAELSKRGVEYKTNSKGNIQIQGNTSFATIFPQKDGKFIVNTTSGTIENPSKASNATWYGSDPKSLDDILNRYGKKQEAPKKEPAKPAAPKKITKFAEGEVESELKGFLKSGMKITDVDIDKDGKSFTAYIDTGERGPRTDHGGGPDGDGWMSYEQVEKLRKTYGKPFEPTLDKIKNEFGKRFKGTIKGQVDYGEKGHVGLYISGKLS